MPRALFLLACLLIVQVTVAAQEANQPPMAATTLSLAVGALTDLVEPAAAAEGRTVTATVRITRAVGLPGELSGMAAQVAYQAPDRLLFSTRFKDADYRIGRIAQTLWIHTPSKKFGVVGTPGRLRFAADPTSIDHTQLAPIQMPLSKWQWATLLASLKPQARPDEIIDGVTCRIVLLSLALYGFPNGRIELATRVADHLPARIRLTGVESLDVEIQLTDLKISEALPDERWTLQPDPGDTIEQVAVSHLTNFLDVAPSLLNANRHLRTLGPAAGWKRLLARTGEGRLETHDETLVLFLKGTPEAMGRQQGTLLQGQVQDLTRRILYGYGVGSSFAKGAWFFGEIERAHARLSPFISPDTYAEMDALAKAAGLHPQEVRLANVFPELFHCSGFALTGEATVGGRMYHGRILDYLRGVGLEQNAVVTVYRPLGLNAWVNVGYAGFVGSVTAMNEKHLSIGEMGGRGEGNWDGKPMAQLVREVMEKASTLDEAVEIMRKGPRTCEYYYVVADGKTKKAVGIEATPEKFITVSLGEFHPKLPHPMKDCVLLSADDRYLALVERVKANYGRIDDAVARSLMERPVAMNSNIHSVLFAPDTLDFWVANADAKNPASHTRYTHHNLRDLLPALPSR